MSDDERIYVRLIKEEPGFDMTGLRKMSVPVWFSSNSAATPSKISVVSFNGFSMATWATPNNMSEIYTMLKWPDQIRPKNSIYLRLMVALGATEATASKFRFKLDYCMACFNYVLNDYALPSTASAGITITDPSGMYSIHEVKMKMTVPETIDRANLSGSDVWMSFRLRRIAPLSGSEVAARPIVFGGVVEFPVDKIFGKF